MNQDYLWDKLGEDAEIEKLENALQAFRYRETAPPALPINITPIHEKRAKRNYRLVYAVAACAAFSIVALSVWLQTLTNQPTFQTEMAKTTAPSSNREISLPDKLITADVADETIKKTEISKKLPGAKTLKLRKTVSVVALQNKAAASNRKAVRQTVITLTTEEKYAYDQLMLALSITSSRLKMIKDKVAGLEEPKAVSQN